MSTRRDFFKELAGGAAAFTVGSVVPGFSASARAKVAGANDRINVAVIGVNARGKAISTNLSKLHDECNVAALCDVDSRALETCQGIVAKYSGTTPKGYKDLRKLLENKDIDAVFIAMPDHWHAPAAIMAMQAGKHVYLEKPTSHNPAENELLIRAISKYGKVAQAGNQRRSWPNVVAGMNEVRSGAIGKVQYAKAWYTNNRDTIGVGKPAPVPDWLDWDLWQGPAPRRAYKDNIVHYNWHWFWHWGTGEALNNGTHFVDMLRWGLGVEYPTMVSSVGGRYRFQDDWETPDTQMISFQFANGMACSWEGRSCNQQPVDGMGSGVAFYGDTGTVFIPGGNEYKITDIKGRVIKEVKSNVSYEQGNLLGPSEQLDAPHFINFFNGIRKGEQLHSPVYEACISTQLVELGNISQRVGRSLKIDPSNGRIIGDKKAMKFWGREYEKGWEPKV